MTSRVPTQCRACVHFDVKTGVCDAFPGGIPDDIIFWGFDHRGEFPNDRGVRFELKPGEEAEEDFANWQSVFA